jgi:membrane protein
MGSPNGGEPDRPPTRAGLAHRLGAFVTLGVRTLRDSKEDRLPGLAAELSFYAVFSLPPLLLALLGAIGYVGRLVGPELTSLAKEQMLQVGGAFLTEATIREIVEPALTQLLQQGRADIAFLGLVLAIWSASRATRVLIDAVTIAYDLEDDRSFWKRTLLALGVTVAGIIVVAALLPLLVVGPRAGAAFAARFGMATIFEILWKALYWPVVATLGISLLAWVYHVAAPWKTAWRRDLPGAILALLIWLGGSAGLRVYAVRSIESNSAYAAFAAPLVVLLWIYVTSASLLLGAELNAEVEKLWPTEPKPS